jgi:hypothetical protein
VTSVASFDDATTAGNFTLVFSGIRIPSSAWLSGTNGWVDSFNTNVVRFEAINRRQCYASTTVILDGRFPAFSFEHEFVLYTETGSLGQLVEAFNKLAFDEALRDVPVPLRLEDGDTGNAVVEYGNCYLETAGLDQPSSLLLYRAGFLRVTFVGNTKPIVNNLP